MNEIEKIYKCKNNDREITEMGYWDFIANVTLAYLIQLGLSAPEKRLQDWEETDSVKSWHSHSIKKKFNKSWWYCKVMLGCHGIVVMIFQLWNHTWYQNQCLMKEGFDRGIAIVYTAVVVLYCTLHTQIDGVSFGLAQYYIS